MEIKCPYCETILEECYDEVDIGVGIQRHTFGFECGNCGAQFGICECGAVEGIHPHASFCTKFKII